MKKVLAAVSLLFWAGCASAITFVEPGLYTTDLFAERPYLTEKAMVLDQGKFEVQGGYAAFLTRSNTMTQSVRIHLNYGVTKDMTLGICFPFGGDVPGVNNSQLGIKYSFNPLLSTMFPNKDLMDVSFSYSCALGSMGYSVKLIMGKDWGNFRLYGNLGYLKHETSKTGIIYGLATNFLVGRKLNLGCEVMGTIERDTGAVANVNVTAGMKYWISDYVAIDLGVGTCLTSDPMLFATTGFSWIIGQ